jgi:hypothetical protein
MKRRCSTNNSCPSPMPQTFHSRRVGGCRRGSDDRRDSLSRFAYAISWCSLQSSSTAFDVFARAAVGELFTTDSFGSWQSRQLAEGVRVVWPNTTRLEPDAQIAQVIRATH